MNPYIIELTDEVIVTDDFEIKRTPFEKWADCNDKREWEMDYSDDRGEHIQVLGKMSWDEYYASELVVADLREYNTVRDNSGKLKNLPDLGKAFKSLVNKSA